MLTLVYILGGIALTSSLLLLAVFALNGFLKWLDARRRSGNLLRTVLTQEQYCQLKKRGYVDIPSPRDPRCIYRVPYAAGLVGVIENGRRKASLCLQPLEWIPDADVVVIHKLMIEADEETYLQKANRISSQHNDNRED